MLECLFSLLLVDLPMSLATNPVPASMPRTRIAAWLYVATAALGAGIVILFATGMHSIGLLAGLILLGVSGLFFYAAWYAYREMEKEEIDRR